MDLVEYEQKIMSDLTAASKASVADYIAESVHFAKLHKWILLWILSGREINDCDALLEQIQTLLHTYQGSLTGVANEIRNLQVKLEKGTHC